MPFLPLQLAPGFFRNGTKYQAKGRWYDGTLVRWYDGAGPQPIGGWTKIQEGSPASDIDVAEPIRGMLAWTSNTPKPYLAFGTALKAYGYVEGTIADITPGGFTTGDEDASFSAGGYGDGVYSAGPYGTSNPLISTLTEANSWQMDNFGETLVAVAYSDGKLYAWDLNVSNNLVVVSNAPEDNIGVVVTPERFLVALGAGGDPRNVAWADQETSTVWTPTATNQAGDFPLTTPGVIMCGRRTKNETLIWTSVDVWAMRYIGGTFVYQFLPVGSNCGVISKMATVVVDNQAMWMGDNGFFIYDGYTKSVPCDVSDYVFSDINRSQASKIFGRAVSEFHEVTWHYPSAGSTENDRYVTFNWVENHWTFGELDRTAGVDAGAFSSPIACDSTGAAYNHETGTAYLDTDDATTLVPTAESGPVELGKGDQVMDVLYLVPDEKTLGDVQATFFAAFYPNEAETTHGPYTLAKRTSTRFAGRQVRLKLTQVSPSWRFGVPRLDVRPGGDR